MRKVNQEIHDRKIIEEILSGGKILRLAINDNPAPYIVPFNYGYNNNVLYVHCAPEGKKIDLLKINSVVGFEIEHTAEIIKSEKACNWAALYRSVTGHGKVEIITEDDQKIAGLDIIMKHNGFEGETEYGRKPLDSMIILKINIEFITGKQSGNWDKQ